MKKTTSRLVKLMVIFFLLMVILVLGRRWPTLFKKDTAAFPGLKKESIEKLVFTDDKDKNEIVRRANRWFVGEFPSDEERVNRVIAAISGLQKDDIVSKNQTKYAVFGVEGKRKIAFNNHVVYVGEAAGFSQTYLRVDDDPLVYVVGADWTSFFYPNDFRDLRVYLFNDEDKVDRLSLFWGGKTLALIKKKADWWLGDAKAKKERVDFLLNEIKTLKGSNLVKKDQIETAKYPEAVRIELIEAKKTKRAVFYQQDKDNYYLQQTDSAWIYQIPASYVASLKKEDKDLLDPD